MSKLAVITGLAIVGAPIVVGAQPIIEVGGTTGVHFYSESSELGVPDIAAAPSQQNAAPLGVRLGLFWPLVAGLEIGPEAELAMLPSISRVQSFDVWTMSYRAHAALQYPLPALPRLMPFAVVGVGAFQVFSTEGQDTIGRDTDAAFYFGPGIKYVIKDGWGARADVRFLFPPSSMDDGTTTEYELLVSVYKEFGRKTEVIDNDPDRDRIVGDNDKCPMDPEDFDQFEDVDGCPDLDNDKDTIADASDKCINDPEDLDGFEDVEGCPDPDNDKDAIADAADKCVNEPEDKDSFEDEDGCPDLDNDKDTIADAQDKCINDPETANGFEDADGCPDVLPVVVKQFTGVIQGINFKLGKAEILATSHPTLDAAVRVLNEFTDLKLEIQGHTDDRPMIPFSPYKNNQELSQARAEAVKDYMVRKGVAADRLIATGLGDSQPVVPVAGLQRRDLEAARAKNRRVEFKVVSSAPAAPNPTTPAPTAPPAAPAPQLERPD